MKYRNLKDTKTDKIVKCLLKSFAGYFVEMPSGTAFWKERFKNARVDKTLSWGAFNNDKLVGFVINGVDTERGVLTAFNTGTGVLPEFRENQIVDKMYNYGISELKKKGVKRCSLEVITKNKKAIRVYQRIGFKINHKLFCYKGNLLNNEELRIQEVKLKDIYKYNVNQNYSWDNTNKTISMAGETYKAYNVFKKNKDEPIGYFIINPLNGYIAQLESKNNNWKSLFEGISQIQKEVRINNVKENRKQLLSYLKELKFENTINQIEMEMNI
jgi:ribosomal protein S18 acetylase RimI-like enzyme